MRYRIVSLVLIVGLVVVGGCSNSMSYDASRVDATTLEELREFWLSIDTPKREYVLGQYDCKHFASDVWRAAYDNGIEASIVIVGTENRVDSHAMVAFRVASDNVWPMDEYHWERAGNYTGPHAYEYWVLAESKYQYWEGLFRSWQKNDVIIVLDGQDAMEFWRVVVGRNTTPIAIQLAVWKYNRGVAQYD